jgi:formylglycine-generating enzyme required for sulfatase activity
MRPVGALKPNDLGLFDMHGNAWEWCQDRWKDNQESQRDKIIVDKDDITYISDGESSPLRGGSFGNRAVYARSAYRSGNVPAYRGFYIGCRPARTYR